MKYLLSICLLLLAQPAFALINPKVQPRHYFDGYKTTAACRVDSVDSTALTVTLTVEKTMKGDFAPKKVTLKTTNKELLESVLSLGKGQMIVAFIGRDRPRSAVLNVIYYAGGGKWYKAQISAPETPDQWELLGDADEGKDAHSADIMFGVFNGSVENLAAMMDDMAAGRAYYPAQPFARFSAVKIGEKLSGPIGGVAIGDVNGDGLLDIIATSAAGDRIFSQSGKVTFKDTTEAFGLKTKSHSVSVADANGDGAPDLLLDGVLYLQKEQKFIATESVPKQNEVISAAFVEIDGDGFPDIVVSRKNGGLAVFANDKKGGAFTDLTAKLGLAKEENGAKGSGYFEAGDWDGNGRTDLIYLTGSGLILHNNKEGFTATQIGKEGEEYQWTTAAMAPLIHPDRSAAFVAHADGKFLIENDRGEVADITHYGNEIQDDITGMFDAVAEDITADGTLDIFAGTRAQGATSFYVMNRGYGSFMLPEKYAPGLMPREVFNHASGGIAVGDINGDGANDLVTGGADGQLWMVQNETLTNRKLAAEEATLGDERKQIEARIVTVSVDGKTGVLGAKLALISADGHLVAARQIGSNIGIGCSGPARVIFTVREPGAYKLGVTFPDGTTVSQPVDLSATQPRHQKITVRKATEP